MLGSSLILSGLFLLAAPADSAVLFHENFDGQLSPDLEWIRQDKKDWRLKDGRLEVLSQAGRIWGGNDAENLLLVEALPAKAMAARVTVAHEPKELYEQAGILWYVDDDNFVKLISEQIEGKMYIVLAREVAGRGKVISKIEVPGANLELRLKVEPDGVTGQWRFKDTDDWSSCDTFVFEAQGRPRFGLFTQNGSATVPRWVRFDRFVIEKLP
ncbi:MAG: beta-xylosidase family glycoside hydrolase [Thermoguttaceae bacterium]